MRQKKIEQHLTLEEVRDLVVDMSRGGDPAEFIPTTATVKLERKRGQPPAVVITWKEGDQ